MMLSSTLSPRKMEASCGRYPIPLRARTYMGSSVTSAPSSRTRPVSGAVKPTTIENVVVLPAPLGPSSPTTSPDEISRLTPLTTVRPL